MLSLVEHYVSIIAHVVLTGCSWFVLRFPSLMFSHADYFIRVDFGVVTPLFSKTFQKVDDLSCGFC